MRISDWSSDVCSSDLVVIRQQIEQLVEALLPAVPDPIFMEIRRHYQWPEGMDAVGPPGVNIIFDQALALNIGRTPTARARSSAWCRSCPPSLASIFAIFHFTVSLLGPSSRSIALFDRFPTLPPNQCI